MIELDVEFGYWHHARMDERPRVPVQARAQRTRREILAAAGEEFGKRGYAMTTAKSIASRANVATGTFYHYFSDKDAVLRELVATRVAAIETSMVGTRADAAIHGDAADALTALRHRVRKDVRSYMDYHVRQRGLHAVLSERRLCDPALDALVTEAERRGIRRIAESLQQWGFEGDRKATAFMIFSLLDGAVHSHVLGQPSVSDARFVEALVTAILRIAASPHVWIEMANAK